MFFLELHGLGALLDAEGRPLDETPGPNVPHTTAFTMRRCPYAGVRKNHARPMNVSALAQMTAHWDGAMGQLRAIRRACGVEGRPSLNALLEMCGVAVFKPVVLWRLGEDVIDVETAVTHKIVVGLQSALHAFVVKGWRGQMDSALLAGTAERDGFLVGDSEVCAGPPNLIREALDVFVDGKPGGARRRTPDAELVRAGRLGNAVQLGAMLFASVIAPEWRWMGARFPSRNRPPMVRGIFASRRDVSARIAEVMGEEGQMLLDGMRGPAERLRWRVPSSWRGPLERSLHAERVFLRWLMDVEKRAGPSVRQGVKVPEGLHLSAWLGPMPRDVVEKRLGWTVQNWAGGVTRLRQPTGTAFTT